MDSWLLWWAVLMIWFIGSLFFIYLLIRWPNFDHRILLIYLSFLSTKRRYKSYVCSVLRRHLWITFCSCLNFLDMLLTTFCILNMYYLYYFCCMTYVKVFSLILFSRYEILLWKVRCSTTYFKYYFSTCSPAQALIISISAAKIKIIYLFFDQCWTIEVKCQLLKVF